MIESPDLKLCGKVHYVQRWHGRHGPPPRTITFVTQCSEDRLPALRAITETWGGLICCAVYVSDPVDRDIKAYNRSIKRTTRAVEKLVKEATATGAILGLTICVLANRHSSHAASASRNSDVASASIPREDSPSHGPPISPPGELHASCASSNTSAAQASQPKVDGASPPSHPTGTVASSILEFSSASNHRKDHTGEMVTIASPPSAPWTVEAVRMARGGMTALTTGLRAGRVAPFCADRFPVGHHATRFDDWLSSQSDAHAPRCRVEYEEGFEPYAIAFRPYLPPYDERFSGYGRNKVVYFRHLASLGFSFWTLSGFFLLHIPHPPSRDQRRTLRPQAVPSSGADSRGATPTVEIIPSGQVSSGAPPTGVVQSGATRMGAVPSGHMPKGAAAIPVGPLPTATADPCGGGGVPSGGDSTEVATEFAAIQSGARPTGAVPRGQVPMGAAAGQGGGGSGGETPPSGSTPAGGGAGFVGAAGGDVRGTVAASAALCSVPAPPHGLSVFVSAGGDGHREVSCADAGDVSGPRADDVSQAGPSAAAASATPSLPANEVDSHRRGPPPVAPLPLAQQARPQEQKHGWQHNNHFQNNDGCQGQREEEQAPVACQNQDACSVYDSSRLPAILRLYDLAAREMRAARHCYYFWQSATGPARGNLPGRASGGATPGLAADERKAASPQSLRKQDHPPRAADSWSPQGGAGAGDRTGRVQAGAMSGHGEGEREGGQVFGMGGGCRAGDGVCTPPPVTVLQKRSCGQGHVVAWRDASRRRWTNLGFWFEWDVPDTLLGVCDPVGQSAGWLGASKGCLTGRHGGGDPMEGLLQGPAGRTILETLAALKFHPCPPTPLVSAPTRLPARAGGHAAVASSCRSRCVRDLRGALGDGGGAEEGAQAAAACTDAAVQLGIVAATATIMPATATARGELPGSHGEDPGYMEGPLDRSAASRATGNGVIRRHPPPQPSQGHGGGRLRPLILRHWLRSRLGRGTAGVCRGTGGAGVGVQREGASSSGEGSFASNGNECALAGTGNGLPASGSDGCRWPTQVGQPPGPPGVDSQTGCACEVQVADSFTLTDTTATTVPGGTLGPGADVAVEPPSCAGRVTAMPRSWDVTIVTQCSGEPSRLAHLECMTRLWGGRISAAVLCPGPCVCGNRWEEKRGWMHGRKCAGKAMAEARGQAEAGGVAFGGERHGQQNVGGGAGGGVAAVAAAAAASSDCGFCTVTDALRSLHARTEASGRCALDVTLVVDGSSGDVDGNRGGDGGSGLDAGNGNGGGDSGHGGYPEDSGWWVTDGSAPPGAAASGRVVESQGGIFPGGEHGKKGLGEKRAAHPLWDEEPKGGKPPQGKCGLLRWGRRQHVPPLRRLYPINLMRNAAMDGAESELLLVLDVDMMPCGAMVREVLPCGAIAREVGGEHRATRGVGGKAGSHGCAAAASLDQLRPTSQATGLVSDQPPVQAPCGTGHAPALPAACQGTNGGLSAPESAVSRWPPAALGPCSAWVRQLGHLCLEKRCFVVVPAFEMLPAGTSTGDVEGGQVDGALATSQAGHVDMDLRGAGPLLVGAGCHNINEGSVGSDGGAFKVSSSGDAACPCGEPHAHASTCPLPRPRDANPGARNAHPGGPSSMAHATMGKVEWQDGTPALSALPAPLAPAFTKDALRALWQAGGCRAYHSGHYPAGHSPVDLGRYFGHDASGGHTLEKRGKGERGNAHRGSSGEAAPRGGEEASGGSAQEMAVTEEARAGGEFGGLGGSSVANQPCRSSHDADDGVSCSGAGMGGQRTRNGEGDGCQDEKARNGEGDEPAWPHWAYRVDYREGFEPYGFVARRYAPRFDERFQGWSYDKVSWFYQLHSSGVAFAVDTRHWLVDLPHATSPDRLWDDDRQRLAAHHVIAHQRAATHQAVIQPPAFAHQAAAHQGNAAHQCAVTCNSLDDSPDATTRNNKEIAQGNRTATALDSSSSRRFRFWNQRGSGSTRPRVPCFPPLSLGQQRTSEIPYNNRKNIMIARLPRRASRHLLTSPSEEAEDGPQNMASQKPRGGRQLASQARSCRQLADDHEACSRGIFLRLKLELAGEPWAGLPGDSMRAGGQAAQGAQGGKPHGADAVGSFALRGLRRLHWGRLLADNQQAGDGRSCGAARTGATDVGAWEFSHTFLGQHNILYSAPEAATWPASVHAIRLHSADRPVASPPAAVAEASSTARGDVGSTACGDGHLSISHGGNSAPDPHASVSHRHETGTRHREAVHGGAAVAADSNHYGADDGAVGLPSGTGDGGSTMGRNGEAINASRDGPSSDDPLPSVWRRQPPPVNERMAVLLPKGCWSPQASEAAGVGVGGFSTKSRVHKLFPKSACRAAVLRFDLYFPPEFDWVLGGALPGLYTTLDTLRVRFQWKSGGVGLVRVELAGHPKDRIGRTVASTSGDSTSIRASAGQGQGQLGANKAKSARLPPQWCSATPFQFLRGRWHQLALSLSLCPGTHERPADVSEGLSLDSGAAAVAHGGTIPASGGMVMMDAADATLGAAGMPSLRASSRPDTAAAAGEFPGSLRPPLAGCSCATVTAWFDSNPVFEARRIPLGDQFSSSGSSNPSSRQATGMSAARPLPDAYGAIAGESNRLQPSQPPAQEAVGGALLTVFFGGGLPVYAPTKDCFLEMARLELWGGENTSL
eukprot:jgi/Mesvir1/11748/Mv00120-RA.2